MTTVITATIQLKSGQALTPTATTSTFMLYSGDKLYRTNVRPLSSSSLVNALCIENAFTKEIRWSVGGIATSSSFLPANTVANAQLVRGNLVVSNTIGGVVFTSGLPDVNSSPNVLKLNADGSLSIIDPSSATQLERWRSFVYRLTEGQTISTTMLYSPNNKYSGVLSGGKFRIVERATNVTTWSTEITFDMGTRIAALKFQGGNLIGTNSMGGVLLHTGLPASTGSYFQVNNDGTASVYSSTGTVLWSTYCSLFMGQKLFLNQSLYSADRTKRVSFGNFTVSSTRAYLVNYYMSGSVEIPAPIVQTSSNTFQFDWSTFPFGSDVSSNGYLQLLPSGELAMFNSATAITPFWKTASTGGLGSVGLFVTPASTGVTLTTLNLLNSFGTTSDPKLWENNVLSTSKFKTVLTTNDGVIIKPFSQATFGLYNTDYTTRFQLTNDGRLQVVNQATKAVIWSTSTWNLPGTSFVDPASQIVNATMFPVLTGYNSANGVVFRANTLSSFASVFTLQVQGGGTGITMSANGLPTWDSRNTLVPGQKLMRGQSLRSIDNAVEFKFDNSGTLLIQRYTKTSSSTVSSTPSATIWSVLISGTSGDSFVTIGAPGSSVSGQIVVYATATSTTPLWKSGSLTQSVIGNLVVANRGVSLTEVIPSVQLVTSIHSVVWQNGGVTELSESKSLLPGEKLISLNSAFECVLTTDGLFQIRNASTQAVTWSTATWPLQWDTTGAIDPLSRITEIKMTQGNLIGLNSANKVIFDAGVTPGLTTLSNNTFRVTDDGKGAIVATNGFALWRTDCALYPGQKLMRGQMLSSTDDKVKLSFNASGQLQILSYFTSATTPVVTTLWAGVPSASPALTESSYVTMLPNGDMVIYRSSPATNSNAVWWSVTDYGAPTRLQVRSLSGVANVSVFFMGQALLSSVHPIWTNGNLVLPTLASGSPVRTVTELSSVTGVTTMAPFSTNPLCVVSSDKRYMCHLTNDGRFRIVDTIAQASFKDMGFGVVSFYPQTVKWSVGGYDAESSIIRVSLVYGNIMGVNSAEKAIFNSFIETVAPMSIKFIVNTDGTASMSHQNYAALPMYNWISGPSTFGPQKFITPYQLYVGQKFRPGDSLYRFGNLVTNTFTTTEQKVVNFKFIATSASSVAIELSCLVIRYLPTFQLVTQVLTTKTYSISPDSYLMLLPNGQLVLTNDANSTSILVARNDANSILQPYNQNYFSSRGFPIFQFKASSNVLLTNSNSQNVASWTSLYACLANAAKPIIDVATDLSCVSAPISVPSTTVSLVPNTTNLSINSAAIKWPI